MQARYVWIWVLTQVVIEYFPALMQHSRMAASREPLMEFLLPCAKLEDARAEMATPKAKAARGLLP